MELMISRGTEVGLGRELDARARARAALGEGAATACTTSVITYLQRTYLDPYLQIRRMISSPGPRPA